MGCCGTGSVQAASAPSTRARPTRPARKTRESDDELEQRRAGPKLRPEEVEDRRRKIVESAERRAAKQSAKGLPREEIVEQRLDEEKQRRIEQYERDNPRQDQFTLQYKA